MGKANRAKSAAERKDAQRWQRQYEQHQQQEADRRFGSLQDHNPADYARELINVSVDLQTHGEQESADQYIALLSAMDGPVPEWPRIVDHELTGVVTSLITKLWRNGWQPADVVRLITRLRGKTHAATVTGLIAQELRTYAPATLPERWVPHLDTVGSASRQEPRLLTITHTLELLQSLRSFPRLDRLGPIPGEARRNTTAPHTTADKRTLTRVRGLLAKAESTTFEAEAETFTAAAQRLMAKHSIDVAMLDAHVGADRYGPSGIRIGVDSPYEHAKASLLAVVAGTNRCRAIWNKELGFSTVLGFEADLDAVELLFTSLLVQATTAIVHSGSKRFGSGQSRTRSFRESFLQSFTTRIGERLDEATAETVQAEAEARGTDLVPVLAARLAEVDEAVDAMFPELAHTRMRGASDREGWAAGRAAADQARLAVGDQVTS